MATKEQKAKQFATNVKDYVELIYACTNGVEYKEPWKQYNNRILEETVTTLVKRGVLEKKTWYNGNRGAAYSFTWKSSMAPTPTLVKNVINDMREKRREKDRKHRERVMATQKPETHYQLEDAIVELAKPEPKDIRTVSIEGFCDKELWEELKKRGYSIENNKLVRITKIYLD